MPSYFIIVICAVLLVVVLGRMAHCWVRVMPGRVAVIRNLNTGDIVTIYHKPGRYWIGRIKSRGLESLRLTVGRPVLVYSEPVEARSAEGTPIRVIVCLVLTITDLSSYVAAVTQKRLDEWRRQTLPGSVAAVISGYPAYQIREQQAEVDRAIVIAAAARLDQSFGLTILRAELERVSIGGVTLALPRLATAAQLIEFVKPDPLGDPGRWSASGLGWKRALKHIRHHGQQTYGQVVGITSSTSSGSNTNSMFSSSTTTYWVAVSFECDGRRYRCQTSSRSSPRVRRGDIVVVRYCPYYPEKFAVPASYPARVSRS